MKIVKPYGETRVNSKTERVFLPNSGGNTGAGGASIHLSDFLSREEDVLIAVWVSSIDKIFGKPEVLPKPTLPTNASEEEKIQMMARRALKVGKAKQLLSYRRELAEKAVEHILKGHTPEQEALFRKKWEHKLNLSNDVGDEAGCYLRGRLSHFFFETIKTITPKPPEDFLNDARIADAPVVDIEVLFEKLRGYIEGEGDQRGQRYGILKQRGDAVHENTPDKSIGTSFMQGRAVDNCSAKDIDAYLQAGAECPIAEIYRQAKDTQQKKEKDKDKDKQQTENKDKAEKDKPLSRKALLSIIGNTLSEHFRKVFVDEIKGGDLKALRQAGHAKYALFLAHSQIKAFYKHLLGRKSIYLNHFPQDAEALKTQMGYRDDNQEINALIRLGKVIHYQWMDDQERTGKTGFDFATLENVEEAKSRYWTSLGQFKIKNDEAFIRIWRHCLTLANWSLSYWADPEWKRDRDQFDIIAAIGGNGDKPFATPDHLKAHSPLLFGVEGQQILLSGNNPQSNTETRQITLIRYAKKLLQTLRNESFHFHAVLNLEKLNFSNFFGETFLKKAEQERIHKSILEFYEKARDNQGKQLAANLKGLRLDECISEAEWPAFESLLMAGMGGGASLPLPLPRFTRLWKRANELDKLKRRDFIKQKVSDSKVNFVIFFPAYPDQLNDPEQARHEPWHQCRFSLLKWVYERAFSEWFDQQPLTVTQKWLDDVALFATWRAQAINKTPTPFEKEVTAKAAKLLETLKAQYKTLSPRDFIAALNAEVQKLSADQTSSGTANFSEDQSARAKAIEDFKLDFFVWAFEVFSTHPSLSSDSQEVGENKKAALRILSENNNREKILVSAWWNNTIAESLSTKVKDKLQQKNLTVDQKKQRAALYFFLHLVPSDAVSLLYHQLLKWGVLYQSWVDEARATLFSVNHDLLALAKPWQEVMQLYLFIHPTGYTGAAPEYFEVPAWVSNCYECVDDQDKIFKQEDKETAVLRRHLREMMRFGYPHIQSKIASHGVIKIPHQGVMDWLNPEKREAIREAQKKRTRLHKEWSQSRNKGGFRDKAAYQSALTTISEGKHRQSMVLLLDEYKRYMLMIEVFGRLADYSGLWERDGIFLMTLGFYELALKKQGFSPDLKNFGGGWYDFWLQPDGNNQPVAGAFQQALMQETGGIFPKLYKACERLMSKEQRGYRNRFAHFNMLSRNKDMLDLLREIQYARALMSYDRKFKHAITHSMDRIFKQEGLCLTLKFNSSHELSVEKPIKVKTIEHLKQGSPKSKAAQGGKRAKGERAHHNAITEAFHSAHYCTLVNALFGDHPFPPP